MAKFEREVKILDIDVDEVKKSLELLGAEFMGIKNQKVYTYDIPTIYHRYLEALELLKSKEVLIRDVAYGKLSIVLDEFADLLSDQDILNIYREFNIADFNELLDKNSTELYDALKKSKYFNSLIKKFLINPNKWLRLRKSNDKIELTVKHIYNKSDDKIQKVKEYEINTTDFEETNLLINSLGLVRRNYQEKIRHSYKYKTADIEIDEWPKLKPYIEIECDDDKIINEIIEKLELSEKEIVSLNTEQLYKRIGIDVHFISELKF